MTRTLLIMHDSPDFGGHEDMFLRFLPTIVEQGDFGRIVMRYPEVNRKLADRMAPFASARFCIEGWRFAKKRAEPYLAPFRADYAAAVRSLFEEAVPTTTLLLQGRIENCAVPLLAAPKGTFVVSYIPMAHRMTDMGRSALFGDRVRRRLYRRPSRFIVPASAVAAQVRAAGGRGPAVVVDNVVTPPVRSSREAARDALDLPRDARVALFLGRMESRQKGLDTLFEAMRRQAPALEGWTFLFVGAGEAEEACRELSVELAKYVDIRGPFWSDQPHSVLAAADIMLMPSRWEGVPLVMLEAMAYGVPILASNIDVFRDYLPDACRIDFATDELAPAMERVLASHAAHQKPGAHRLSEINLAASASRFVAALDPERTPA
ncbi:MAG: glycosyltransferase family 4 protein [Sphingomonadales bacterium]|nr:glycosyltransferase family 4 protein [Sphingomonadales bacterium]MDE2171656.1 glycosyltransferase family 4 protein [Sphingomonadales bacterium]